MKNAILAEAKLHPFSQPQDYIKLIFQSEFGPGHLIPNADYARKRLYDEWEQVKNLPAEQPQDIGGGYIRLCIKGVDESELEKINHLFVTAANEKTGSNSGFMAKLDLMVAMASENLLPFDAEQANTAVKEYLAGGIRPTSHTEIYHSHYAPAYRVVKKDITE